MWSVYTPIIYIGFLQDSHGKIISLCSVSYMVSLDCLFHDLGWLSLLKALLLVFFFLSVLALFAFCFIDEDWACVRRDFLQLIILLLLCCR